MNGARAEVLGCMIDRLDMDATVERCDELIRARAGAHQVSINVAKLVALQRDARLRRIVEDAELVNADGQPVVWASRLLGDPLPERVAGIDLMRRLLSLASEQGYRVFILGAHADVLEAAVERLKRTHPELDLAGYRDGWFDDVESPVVCAEIRAARPDVLFVAMSSPRKEYWIAQHGQKLEVPFCMGVGGAIDVIAGRTRRAPEWIQAAGLEWLYRAAQEPGRLGGRYLSTNMRFGLLLGRELVRARRRRTAHAD